MKTYAPVRTSGKSGAPAKADDNVPPSWHVLQAFPTAPRGAMHDFSKMVLPLDGGAADRTRQAEANRRVTPASPSASLRAGAAGALPPNRTGLPDGLKAGIEHVAGLSMDDVRVHYQSRKPAQLQALAYTQGTAIHVGPGQEKYLPHEAWHVVQQKQGRVKPTLQMKGSVPVNDDRGLEQEADAMGTRAASLGVSETPRSMRESALVPVRPFASGVMQKKHVEVTVTGITHLVEAKQGSIMEGEEGPELKTGQTVVIETSQKLRSRRGPNQEVFSQLDRDRQISKNKTKAHGDVYIGKDYRWFRVVSVGDAEQKEGIYIRDETFRTLEPEALGHRPAIIGGFGRDRMKPEQAEVHDLAGEIIRDSAHAPSSDKVISILNDLRQQEGWQYKMNYVHLMRVAHAFSKNLRIKAVLASGQDASLYKEVSEFLRRAIGRQLVQSWGDGASNIVASLGSAWEFFQMGVEALKDDVGALNKYLRHVLDHDKGYAQTLESAMEYSQHTPQSGTQELPFTEILQNALNSNRNISIWTSISITDTFRKQLNRKPPAESAETKEQERQPPEQQENNMWETLVGALIAGLTSASAIAARLKTIEENIEVVYRDVRGIVPQEFELNKGALTKAIDTCRKDSSGDDSEDESESKSK
jgi:hypothetical protein